MRQQDAYPPYGEGQSKICSTPSPRFATATFPSLIVYGLSTRRKGSRMMSPPGLQIKLRPSVTSTFDLLTPRSTVHDLEITTEGHRKRSKLVVYGDRSSKLLN